MNKSGSIRDIGLLAVVLFSVAIISFVLLFVYNTSTDLMIASPAFAGEPADVLTETQDTLNLLDYVIMAVFIGFFLGTIILAYLVAGVPVFMAMYLLFFIVVSVLSGILTSVWDNISGMVIFGTTINNLPITAFLLSNLTLMIVITGFIGLIVMYVRGERVQ